jgi:hypothetical protein
MHFKAVVIVLLCTFFLSVIPALSDPARPEQSTSRPVIPTAFHVTAMGGFGPAEEQGAGFAGRLSVRHALFFAGIHCGYFAGRNVRIAEDVENGVGAYDYRISAFAVEVLVGIGFPKKDFPVVVHLYHLAGVELHWMDATRDSTSDLNEEVRMDHAGPRLGGGSSVLGRIPLRRPDLALLMGVDVRGMFNIGLEDNIGTGQWVQTKWGAVEFWGVVGIEFHTVPEKSR